MREVITLHFGGFGINMVPHVHQRHIEEADFDVDPHKFFEETKGEGYKPRAVLADLDFESLELFKNKSPLRDIFDPELMSLPDAYYDTNWSNEDYCEVLDKPIRRALERCDRFDGFVVFNSLSGNAGACLSSKLMSFTDNNCVKAPVMF